MHFIELQKILKPKCNLIFASLLLVFKTRLNMNAARDLFANLCFPESNFRISRREVSTASATAASWDYVAKHQLLITRLCLEAGGIRRCEVTHWRRSNYCPGVVIREGSVTPNSPRVTWPEQTNNIAGCKTPSTLDPSLTEEIHRHGIKVSPLCLGLVEGRNPLLCVYSLSAISQLLIIREMSVWYWYGYGNDLIVGQSVMITLMNHGGVKSLYWRHVIELWIMKKKKQPCYVELLFTLGLVQHPLCHLHQGIQMVEALFVVFFVAF